MLNNALKINTFVSVAMIQANSSPTFSGYFRLVLPLISVKIVSNSPADIVIDTAKKTSVKSGFSTIANNAHSPQLVHAIIKSGVSICPQRDIRFRMPHKIGQMNRVHPRFCFLAAISMAADMRSNVRNRFLIYFY